MGSRHFRQPLAPTESLPRLAKLASIPTLEVRGALDNLIALYFPPILSASTIINKLAIDTDSSINASSIQPTVITSPALEADKAASVPDSGYASAEEDEDEDELVGRQSYDDTLSILQADPFERAYALKWLTGFVSRSDTWLSCSSIKDDGEDEASRSELLEEAAKLVNAFSGDAIATAENDTDECGSIFRSFSFSTPSPLGQRCPTAPTEVTVQLNDAPLSNSDHTSVGLQSWGSSVVLAGRLCSNPSAYSILPSPVDYIHDIAGTPLRVLELGAGTGLLSITTSKIVQLYSGSAEIIATDYHPDVLANLSLNISMNYCQAESSSGPSVSVAVHALDWEHPDYSSPPFHEPFDIILAADVVYHPSHASWIKSCVEQLLVKPGERNIENGRGGVFWLIIPIRTTGRHEGMHRTVENVFRMAGLVQDGKLDNDGSGATHELVILELEEISRRDGVGRADESGYRMYKIGWLPEAKR